MSKLSDRILQKINEEEEKEPGYNVKKRTSTGSSGQSGRAIVQKSLQLAQKAKQNNSGSASKPASSASRNQNKVTSGVRASGNVEQRILNDQLQQNRSRTTADILSERRGRTLPEVVGDNVGRVSDAIGRASQNRVQVRPTVGQEATRETRGESFNDILDRIGKKAETAVYGADSGRRIEGTGLTYRSDPEAQRAIERIRESQTAVGSDYDPTDMINSMGLDEDQQNEFWYRYARDGRRAAVDYAKELASEWAAEDRARDEAEAERFAVEHPVLGSARAIVDPLLSAIPGAAVAAVAGITGSEVDPNHPAFRGDITGEASTRGVQAAAREATGAPEGGWTDQAIGIGLSIGQNIARYGASAAAAAATGGGSAVMSAVNMGLSGTQAAVSTIRQAAEQDGVNTARIVANGIASGIAEGFFEKYSLESLIKMAPADNVKNFVGNLVKQMAIEGSEEMATEISNSISDALIMGESSNFEQYRQEYLQAGASEEEATKGALKQIGANVLYAGFAGAISGGFMAGPAMAINSYRLQRFGSSQSFQTAEDFSELADSVDTSVESYVDQNGNVDEETLRKAQEVQQMAADMAQRSAAGETVNNYQKGELAAKVYDLVNSAERTQIQDTETVDVRLLPVEINDEQSFLEASRQWTNILSRPDFQRADIAEDGASYKIVRDGDTFTISGGRTDDSGFEPMNISAGREQLGTGSDEDIVQFIPFQLSGEPAMSVKVTYAPDQTVQIENMDPAQTVPSPESAAEMQRNPENAVIHAAKSRMSSQFSEEAPGGRSAAASEISGAAINAEESGLSDSAKETMVAMYDGSSPMRNYMTAFRRYYAAGREDLPMSYAENSPYAAFLSTQQKQAAFREGALERNRVLESRRQAAEMEPQEKGAAREGGLTYADRGASEAQRRVAEHVGKRTGLKIEIRKLREVAEYDSENGIIRIDPEAENFNASLAHELTHFIQDYDQKSYEAFKRLAIEALMTSRQESFDELYDRYERPYMEQYGGVDYDIVTDEMAADAAGMFLNDEEFINRVVSEDRSLAEKIRDFFRDIADALRDLISGNVRRVSKALRENETRYRTAQGLWTKALETAGERNRSGEQSVTGAQIKNQLDMSEPVEETKNLIAVHNLDASKLRQVLDLGGFVMPSIAVTRADLGHTNFGDISVVFRKDSIDPSDGRNKIYSADAYTTRMPVSEYEYDAAAVAALADRMGTSSSQLESNYLQGNSSRVQRNLEDAMEMQQLYAESLGETLPEDRYERRDRLREIAGYVSGEYSAEYKAFVENELEQIVKGQGFLRDIDPFDSRGNRRSWRAMHTPYTADSALNMMLSQRGRNQESSIGITADSLRAAISDQYKSIDELHNNENRLQDSAEIADEIENLNDRLYSLTDEIAGESWTKKDAAADALLSAAKRPTLRHLNKYLSKYGMQATAEQAEEFKSIIDELKDIPVRYFEAKPERVVGFNEIAAAVIPDDIDQKLRSRLDGQDIPVIEYPSGDEEARKEAVRSIPNVRFQIRELDDGTPYVDVDVDQERFDRLTPKEQIKEAAKIIRERFADTVIGFGDKSAKITGRTAKEYKGKHYAPDIMEAKARLSPELDGLFNAAQYLGHENDDGHHPEAVGGWAPDTLQEPSIALPWLYATGDKRSYNVGALSNENISQDEASVNPMQQSEDDKKLRKQLSIDEQSNVDPDRLVEANENLQITTQLLSETLSNATYMPSDEQIQRTVRKLKADTRSLISDQELFDRLKTLYNYVQHNDNINGEEMASIAADIADGLLSNSRNEYDPAEVQAYREYLDHIKGYTFEIGEDLLPEVQYKYGSMRDLRSRYFGRLNIKKAEHSNIDQIYQELNEMYPGDFPADTINESDQLSAILDGLDALRPHVKNPADDMSAIDYRGYTYEIGRKIFEDYFTPQAKAEFNDAFKNYREAVQRQYQKNLRKVNKRNQELITKLAQEYESLQTEQQKARNRQQQAELRDQNKRQQQAMMAYRRAADAESRRFYNDRYNIQKDRQIIMKDLSDLNSWLLKPTDKKHVPESLRSSVAQFLSGIDFSSDRLNLKGDPTARSRTWEELRRTYDNIMKGVGTETSQLMDIDPDMLHMIDDLKDATEGLERIGDMDAYQTRTLKNLIKAMKKTITDANRLLNNKRYESVKEAAESTMNDLNGRKRSNIAGKAGKVRDFFVNDQLDAYTRFHTFGSAAESVYTELRKGFDKKILCTKEAADYMQKLLKDTGTSQKDLRKWSGNRVEIIKYKTGRGKEIELTPAHIMELYVQNKRGQSRKHLYNGGITIEFTHKNKLGILSYSIDTGESVKLTEQDVDNLISKLSDKQKKLADGMATFLQQNSSRWGNEASMALYGYEKFNARDYFPIKTERNFIATKDDAMSGGTELIKNMGETKPAQEKVSNPMILGDIFDTFTTHVDRMSSYRAFLVPLSDMQKWLNYRRINYESELYEDLDRGGEKKPFDPDAELSPVYEGSVKQSIRNAYGKAGLEYVEKFIRDINGATTGEPSLMGSVISSFKGAAMGFNISTAIQQPTAYLRAANEISPKYLMRAFPKMFFSKKSFSNVVDHSPIAQWKEWGFYDTHIGPGMKQILMGPANRIEQIRDGQMGLSAKGDEMAWSALWRAAELETMDKHKELKAGSDAYYEAVNERFEEIIDRTQVIDSVFHRSQVMRSKDGLTKMSTAFMSEPAKNYNMLYRALYDAKNSKKGGKAVRAAVAFAMSGIAAAAAKSVVGALRDRDDDKKFKEKYWEALLGSPDQRLYPFSGNMGDNINPLGMIPIARDILSITQGYDVARTDMSLIQELWWSTTDLLKALAGDSKKTVFDTMLTFLQRLSAFSGIGVENLMNDTMSGVHFLIDGAFPGSETAQSLEYELNKLELNVGKKANATQFVRLALQAYAAGQDELGDRIIDEMVEKGEADELAMDTVYDRMGTFLEADERLLPAAEARLNGDTKEYERIKEELMDDGYPDEVIEGKVESALEDMGPSYQDMVDSLNVIYDAGGAFTIDRYKNFNETVKGLAKVLKAKNYWDDAETMKRIKSRISEEYRPRYQAADPDERQQILSFLSQVKYNGEPVYEDADIVDWGDQLLKEDQRLEQLAKYKVEGNDGAFEKLRKELIRDGYSEDAIETKLDTQIKDSAPAYKDLTTELEAIRSKGDFDSSSYKDFDRMAAELVKAYKAKNDWDDKDARSGVKSQLTKYYKPLYKDGNAVERNSILNLLSRVKINGEKIYDEKDIAKWGQEED